MNNKQFTIVSDFISLFRIGLYSLIACNRQVKIVRIISIFDSENSQGSSPCSQVETIPQVFVVDWNQSLVVSLQSLVPSQF